MLRRALATIPEKVLIDFIKFNEVREYYGRSAWHGYLCFVPTKPRVLEVGKALRKIGEQLPGGGGTRL